MNQIYDRYAEDFERIFKVPLSQYWDGRHGGFLMQAFCTQVLDYSGPEPWISCNDQFGQPGNDLISDIASEITWYWRDWTHRHYKIPGMATI